MGPWNDFNSTLLTDIVSSLSAAQILGRAKVFCKILGPIKEFCKKKLNRAKVQNVLKSS